MRGKKTKGISTTIFAIVAIVLLVVGLLVGIVVYPAIFPEEKPEEKPANLVYVRQTGIVHQFCVDVALPRFEELYPHITVDPIGLEWADFHSRAISMYAAGETIDVVQIFSQDIAKWADAGYIRSLEDLPGVDFYKDALIPYAVDSLSYNGKLYGLPIQAALYGGGLYNEVLWQQLKETTDVEEVPTTLDEILQQAIAAKEAGIVEYPLVWCAGVGVEHAQRTWHALTSNMFGGQLFDENFNPLLGEGSDARKALQWWADTFLVYEVSDPASLEFRWFPASRSIASGDNIFLPIAVQPIDAWLVNEDEQHEYSGQVKTILLDNTPVDQFVLCISGTSENVEAAWTLVQFLAGKDPTYTWWARREWARFGIGISYDELLDDAEILSSWNEWGIDGADLMEVFEKGVNIEAVVPAFREPWFPEWNDFVVPLIQDALLGEISVDDACDQMAQEANRLRG